VLFCSLVYKDYSFIEKKKGFFIFIFLIFNHFIFGENSDPFEYNLVLLLVCFLLIMVVEFYFFFVIYLLEKRVLILNLCFLIVYK